MTNYGGP